MPWSTEWSLAICCMVLLIHSLMLWRISNRLFRSVLWLEETVRRIQRGDSAPSTVIEIVAVDDAGMSQFGPTELH